MFLQEHHVRIFPLAKSQACCGVGFDSTGSRRQGDVVHTKCSCRNTIRILDTGPLSLYAAPWSGRREGQSMCEFNEMFLQEHCGKLGRLDIDAPLGFPKQFLAISHSGWM
jgi:hypothetical protein